MKTVNVIKVIGLLVFILSMAALIWGFWSFDDLNRILELSPHDMQFPTPEGFDRLVFITG